MKAGTQKADEIHDYYIKLEELLKIKKVGRYTVCWCAEVKGA